MRRGRGGAALAAALSTLLLAPAAALAGGTWTQSDTNVAIEWQTDGNQPAQQTRFRLTRSVVEASTGHSQACAIGQQPNEIICPVGFRGGPSEAPSGVVNVRVAEPVGCSDQFDFEAADTAGRFHAQQPITPGAQCPSGEGDPPAPQVNDQPAGAPVSRPRLPLVVGADSGGGPRVHVYGLPALDLIHGFLAYDPAFSGGVRVALGDVNGDGLTDVITGAGPGGGPLVKVFDGKTGGLLHMFFAFDQGFRGGVSVAAGDVNLDGRDDIVVGAGPGAGPHVKVFSGSTGVEVRSFFAFDGFTGGVSVAAGDVNGDGRADLVVGAGPGAGPHVKVYDGRTSVELGSLLAFDEDDRNGTHVAAGDVNGDGRDDIIVGTGGSGGGHVKVFDGGTRSETLSFFAFPGFTGSVRVGSVDRNDDGRADILAGMGSSGATPHVKVFSGGSAAVLASFVPFEGFAGGVFVGAMTTRGTLLRTSSLTVRRDGTARVRLSCPNAQALGPCSGIITLRPRRARRSDATSARHAPVLGRARFRVPAGQRGRVQVRLRRSYRRLAVRRRSVRAVAHVSSRDRAGNERVRSQNLTLEAPRRARRR